MMKTEIYRNGIFLERMGGVNNVKDNTIIFAADSIKKEQIFEDISSGSITKT